MEKSSLMLKIRKKESLELVFIVVLAFSFFSQSIILIFEDLFWRMRIVIQSPLSLLLLN